MLQERTQIEFASLSDAVEIGVLSKNEIEYGLGWRYTPKKITELIRHRSKNVVVARSGSTLVGFGIMTYYEHQANLDLLAVKRNYRRMKIGSDIVRWLEKVALTSGAFNVFVQVREQNKGAIQFYEALGYSVIETDTRYYSGVETGVVMARGLKSMIV
ncbi:MAG: GNAT family N-acetyltransferase [Candidatus Thiodiazotropha sp. (ex. Lucinisca nassula)]|nr:GNAT family N-acetyltransferase [Candidatus Thiodiazotropha sp. (ex. Lucinisca nassula)]MBW9275156.1 GNAT family N-acetyltransferase [Candidatus Thiodiazotropha sp. (ex. Lucinisca nassula)]